MIAAVTLLLFASLFGTDRPLLADREPISRGACCVAGAASNGDDFFIVFGSANVATGVAGQRVDNAGRVLDPLNLSLPHTGAVLWNGSEYVVVDTGRYTRVSRHGAVLDPARTFDDPLPRPPGSIPGVTPRAWAGDRMASVGMLSQTLTFTLHDRDFNLVARVDVAGNLVEPRFRLATNGRTFLVTYMTGRTGNAQNTVNGVLFDQNGNVIARHELVGPMAMWGLLTVGSDDEYLVLARNSERASLHWGVIVGGDGAPKRTLGTIGSGARDSSPELLWDGREFSLLDHEPSTTAGSTVVRRTRFSRDGSVVGPVGGVVIGEVRTSDRLTFLGGNGTLLGVRTVVVAPGDFHLEGQFVDSSTRFRLGQTLTTQSFPMMATGNGISLVVWYEQETIGTTIRAARLAPDGAILDPQSIVVASGACGLMDVAWSGSEFLVAWSSGVAIRAVRVSSDGRVLDAEPQALVFDTETCGRIALAANNDGYLVAWTRGFGNSPRTYRMMAQRFSRTLAPLSAPIEVGPSALDASQRAVDVFATSDGRDFAIGWLNFTARISSAGALVQSQAVHGEVEGLAYDGLGFVAFTQARITRILGPISAEEPPFIEAPLPPLRRIRAICEAGVCLAVGSPDTGTNELTLLRVSLTPRSVGVELQSLRVDTPPLRGLSPAIGGTLAQPILAYQRIARELQYGGAQRVFVRGTARLRARPAR